MPHVRYVALCVFRDGSRILVGRGYDSVKRQHFLRPLGGSVEFGELATTAIRREIREELRAEITDLELVAVVENLFICEGEPGHEVVAVFDARFEDGSLYAAERLPLYEEVWGGTAFWLDLAEPFDEPLYPEGLSQLLAGSGAEDGPVGRSR